jgi:hypothetical protein
MAQLNLGRVRPIYRGTYDAQQAYRVLDFVTFNGVTYFCIQDTTAGTDPTDGAFWQFLIEEETPEGLLAKLLTVDGTGSGLDADLLDGEPGSFYQAAATAVTKTSGTGAAFLPTGTQAQRPAAPVEGQIRYNSEFSTFEGYSAGAWSGLGGATGGAGNPAFYENDSTITSSYTISLAKNAMTAGPVTIDDGVEVTVPVGSTWSIV